MKIRTAFRAVPALALSLSAIVVAGPGARADAVADFYKGKTVTVVVSTGASGSYAVFAQLMHRHFSRHIPGAPAVVPSYMPGGGGAKASNFVFNVAPKDGSTIAMLHDYTVVAPVARPKAVKYQVDRFTWLLRYARSNPVIVVMKDSGIKTVADTQAREVVMGSTGRSAPSYINMSVMNQLVGTRFKIITGYKGRAQAEAAMERGEIAGSSAGWMTWQSSRPDWIASGKIVPLVQAGLSKLPELQSVPLLTEFAKNEADRNLLEFISAGGEFGRYVVGPPGLPADRTTALRRALDSLIRDPVFVADAAKRRVSLDPATGEELQKKAKRVVELVPSIKDRAQKIFGN
jgi:tripartite-type tricarboxylate transporter receptor subunit TctC